MLLLVLLLGFSTLLSLHAQLLTKLYFLAFSLLHSSYDLLTLLLYLLYDHHFLSHGEFRLRSSNLHVWAALSIASIGSWLYRLSE